MKYQLWLVTITSVLCTFILLIPSINAQSTNCSTFDSVNHHIIISCGSLRISDLAANIKDPSAIANESPGVWLLDADIGVSPNAKLIIDSKDVKWLKINSPHGINVLGDLVIDSVRITGWGDVDHSDTNPLIINSKTAISLNSTAGQIGNTIKVSGINFAANSPITIKFDDITVTTTPSSITTSDKGEFTATIIIPFSYAGTHTVIASDSSSSSDSKFFTVTGTGGGSFHYTNVVSGLNEPVKIAFIPDKGYGVDGSGNFLVTQKSGQVIVVKYKNGVFEKQSTPFVTVPNVWANVEEEGLIGMAFPPDYTSSHFVYFYASVQLPSGEYKNQVMRYQITTDASGNIVAARGSQQIILEVHDLANGHIAGELKFDSQGNLYIGSGDQWIVGTSQNLQVLTGKILRITPLAVPDANGTLYSIPSTNPFASSPDATIRKEIFSYGLRNPYSFDLDPVTKKLYVSEVGFATVEEIDDSTTPANFGWDTYEGPVVGNPTHLTSYKNPLYYYFHADVATPDSADRVAITGGAFDNGNAYPSEFNGAYFFGDFGRGFIKALLPVDKYPPTIDPKTGVPIAQVVPVISGQPNTPISLAVWKGEVYYTDFDGNAGKLVYAASNSELSAYAGNLPAAIIVNSTSGSDGTKITVSGANFAANSPITVKYDGKTVQTTPTSVVSSATGIFSATFLLPSSASGTHLVRASDAVAETFATTDGQSPRAYLNMDAGATGHMDITNSEIAYMGYLANDHLGISYSGGSGSKIANNNIHDMWFGIYSQHVQGLTVEHNIIHDNVNYGIAPHEVEDMIIRSNQIYNIEKNAGISCGFHCNNILISDNTLNNVTVAGIMLTDFTSGSTIRNNHVTDSGVGISIYNNTRDNSINGNIISDTRIGIKIALNSLANIISQNSIAKSQTAAICLDQSSQNNTLSSNTMDNGTAVLCPGGVVEANLPSNAFAGVQTFTPKIAMVSPSFTFAAYSIGHFYNFYGQYGFPPSGTQITNTDLNMLTASLPHGAFHFYNDPPDHENIIPGSVYFDEIHQFVKKALPEAQIDDLRDEDVHQGKIFDTDGTNLYDIIFLFHQEYVTADEYQNLKTFVANGGTIVFADSNTFTVEVKYSQATDSVTLVKGHNWQFDGKIAQPGPAERWVDDTSSWVGNNFLTDPTYIPITFKNMPFNYKHTEEQYISNPDDTVLIDYNARYPPHHRFNPVVGAHELIYGAGKVESLGFFANQDINDPNLENFIENVILPRATGKIMVAHVLDQTYPVRWILPTGKISQITLEANNILDVYLDRSVKNDDTLRIVFPKNLLGDHPRDDFTITLDGEPVSFRHFTDDIETSFEIILPKEGSLIQINPVIPKRDLSASIQSQKNSLEFGRYYACDLRNEASYVCDLAQNALSAYQVKGNGSKVYSSTSAPTFSPNGQKGSALELNEVRYESLEVPYSKAITPSQFSVSFFIKPKEGLRNYAMIASDVGTKQDSGWYFELVGGASKSVYFNIFLNHDIIRSHQIPISSNEFTHIAATFGGGKISIYKNGQLVETMEKNEFYDLPDALLRIGGLSRSTNVYPLNGMVDEFYLYSRVLQPNEISNIYNLSNVPHDSSLVLYYPFDGDIKDHSGNGINPVKPTLIASMAFAPDGRLFFTQKDTGDIRIMKNDKIVDEPFYHVSDIWIGSEQGLLGLTIDPKFDENHFVYFYYTYHDQDSNRIYNKVVRIVDVNNKGQNPVVILDKIYATDGFHSGGAMTFGPDDKLYITVGDATEHPFAMDPNIVIGKVLRIDRDGSIPSDNPYPNNPVYNIGHRNMYGIAFDHTGYGIVTENGDSFFDEVNDIQKGANYGFPLIQLPNEDPYLFDSTKSVMPLVAFPTTIAPTQAIYYDGNVFPNYQGQFIFGSFDGYILALNIDDNTKTVTSYDSIFVNRDSLEPVVAIAKSPSGDIYYGGYSIYKLKSVDNSKYRFLIPLEVSSSTEDLLFKEIRYLPDQKKIVVVPTEGSKYLSTPIDINLLVSITNVVESVEDSNGNKLKFTSELKSPYYSLDILMNFNG